MRKSRPSCIPPAGRALVVFKDRARKQLEKRIVELAWDALPAAPAGGAACQRRKPCCEGGLRQNSGPPPLAVAASEPRANDSEEQALPMRSLYAVTASSAPQTAPAAVLDAPPQLSHWHCHKTCRANPTSSGTLSEIMCRLRVYHRRRGVGAVRSTLSVAGTMLRIPHSAAHLRRRELLKT